MILLDSVITLYAKMTMPDLQWQKVLNLLSDQNLKETVVFLTQKVLILIISPLLILSKKCASRFCRETANENSSLKNEKSLIHT